MENFYRSANNATTFNEFASTEIHSSVKPFIVFLIGMLLLLWWFSRFTAEAQREFPDFDLM
jgi:hypothetical protein